MLNFPFFKIWKFLQKHWIGGLIIFLPIIISLSPLFFNFIFFAEDPFFFHYPVNFFYKNSIFQGDSFLWNPLNFSGTPTFAASVGFLSPLNYLFFKYLPVFDAYHFLILFYLVFSAFCVGYFLRRAGAENLSQGLGALTYVFANWRIVNDLPIVAVVPLIPLIYVSLWKAEEKMRWIWICIGGIFMGLIILAGHYHYLLEAMFVLFVVSFFIGWIRGYSGWKARIRPVINLLLMFAVAGIAGIIRFIPAFVYAAQSAKEGGVSFFTFASGGLSWIDPLQFFSPYLEVPSYLDRFVNFSGEQKYIGLLPLFFALCVFSFRTKDRLIRFFSIYVTVVLFAALPYSPLAMVLHYIPFLNFITSPARWFFAAPFGISVLAAFGFEKILCMEIDKRVNLLRKIFLVAGIGLASAVIIVWLFVFVFGSAVLSALTDYFDKNLYSARYTLPIEYYHQYIKRIFFINREIFNLFSPRVFLPLVFFFISLFCLKRFFENKIKKELAGVVFLSIIVLNFIFVFSFFHILFPRSVIEKTPISAEFLLKHKEARMISFLPGQSEVMKLAVPYGSRLPSELSGDFLQEMLPSNLNLNYGVSSLDYADNFMSRRMSRVLAYIGGVHPVIGDSLAYENVLPEEKAKMLSYRRNVLNFVGMKYIITAYPFDEIIFKKVYETVWTGDNIKIPIYIYENPGLRPRFYFAEFLEVMPENESAAFEKLKTISEDGLGVFVECGRDVKVGPCAQGPTLNANGQGEIEVETKKNTISILKTKSATSQFLVFSENHLPGWKAYVDSNEVPIYTVGSVYIGVVLPEGEHEVKFEFTYRTIVEEFIKMIKHKF